MPNDADNVFVPADLESILKIEVPLSVQIASRPMRVREIASLAPGAIIELPKLADEQLDVVIGNRTIGMGTAVKVGENFGVRITQVGTMSQRIKAMGADSQGEPPAAEDPTTPAVTEHAQSPGETAAAQILTQ